TMFDPTASAPAGSRKRTGENLQASIETFLTRLCAATGAPVPTVEVESFEPGNNPLQASAEVLLDGQRIAWSSGDSEGFRAILLQAAATPERTVVDFFAHDAHATNALELAVLPREHAAQFGRLLEQFAVPTLRWKWARSEAMHRKVPFDQPLPDQLRTSGLADAQDVSPWTPQDPPTELDQRMGAQERVWEMWAAATGARTRTEAMPPGQRVAALDRLGIPRNPAASDAEVRADPEYYAGSWEALLGADDDGAPVFHFAFGVPDSPLDSFDHDWPPVIRELAAAL